MILEPILCNGGCILPADGFLQELRDITARHGIVLIFDEVITGFRVHLNGAQGLYGITPDLATFGKAVAGGFPLSVIAGRREILKLIEDATVLHGGSFNGNPTVLAASEATLEELSRDDGAALKAAQRASAPPLPRRVCLRRFAEWGRYSRSYSRTREPSRMRAA